MSIPIQIGNTIVQFPQTGNDPSWSQAVVRFAQLVAQQLQGIVGPFDVVPSVQILNNDANSNIDISGANFPNGSVRSFDLDYAVYRTNGVDVIVEEGRVRGIYDLDNSNTWVIQRDYSGSKQTNGTSYHSFSMSGDQLQFSSVAIGGSYDGNESKIAYSARCELVTEV